MGIKFLNTKIRIWETNFLHCIGYPSDLKEQTEHFYGPVRKRVSGDECLPKNSSPKPLIFKIVLLQVDIEINT